MALDLGSAYCKAAISPASLPLDSNGGNRSVAISFGSGGASCTWSANVNASGGVASMTRDIAGNVYFVDSFNSRIRKLFVDTGVITTVAGGGKQGFADNVPATQTQISTPATITLDSTGNLYVVSSVVESRRHRA